MAEQARVVRTITAPVLQKQSRQRKRGLLRMTGTTDNAHDIFNHKTLKYILTAPGNPPENGTGNARILLDLSRSERGRQGA